MDLGLQASLQLLSVFVAFPCIVVLEEEKVSVQERQALSNLKGSRNI